MFTGLIEEIGSVERVTVISSGRQFRIACRNITEDLAPDDSVSVNGVCLTATTVEAKYFEATAVEETLGRSTLKGLKPGDRVNLERALRLNDRLGGHIVQGHVDGVGKIVSLVRQGAGSLLKIQIPEGLSKYTIEKGSIAVDGVSLTIASVDGYFISISVIPHTLQKTTLQFAKPGTEVNIEVDFMGKYVERFLRPSSRDSKMNEAWLRSMGY
jgi:riboflavin synthase